MDAGAVKAPTIRRSQLAGAVEPGNDVRVQYRPAHHSEHR
jgi:hypothetical protein